MIRLTQVALLARLSVRVVRWQPLLGALLLTGALLAWPHAEPLTFRDTIWSLRTIAAAITLASVFVLDDVAADVLAPVPLPLGARTALRVGFALVWIVPVWGVALLVSAPRVPAVWILWSTVELAALLAAGLAGAAVLSRRRGMREPGAAAAAGVAGGLVLLFVLPGPLAMLTLLERYWSVAHLRWSVLLMAGLAVLIRMSGDPARR